MPTLAKQVLERATGLPEGSPLVAKELLHLGSRAAVDQVLSRLCNAARFCEPAVASMCCPLRAVLAVVRRRR